MNDNNIFKDVHTYLIIIFLLMIYLIYKCDYKSVNNSISNCVNEIKNEINQLHEKKKLLSKQIEDLNSSIKNED